MSIKGFEKSIAVIILLGLMLGGVTYGMHMTNTVSQFQDQLLETQQQLSELSNNYSQLQDQITGQGRRYTGNPFTTELWPGQLQSENITGMHWYSYYEGELVNVTDNVLGLGGVELEGDYDTWTYIWTRDYGAEVNIDGLLVDNSGTVYSTDSSAEHAFVRTFAGAETNYPEDYVFGMYFYAIWQEHSSILNRYVMAQNTTYSLIIEVWKDGVMTWSRQPSIDDPLFAWSDCAAMSPSGEYMVIGGLSTETMDAQLVMLYRGS